MRADLHLLLQARSVPARSVPVLDPDWDNLLLDHCVSGEWSPVNGLVGKDFRRPGGRGYADEESRQRIERMERALREARAWYIEFTRQNRLEAERFREEEEKKKKAERLRQDKINYDGILRRTEERLFKNRTG